jgi:hypothetical protein
MAEFIINSKITEKCRHCRYQKCLSVEMERRFLKVWKMWQLKKETNLLVMSKIL